MGAFYAREQRFAEAEPAYDRAIEQYEREKEMLGGYRSAVGVVDCLYGYARVLDQLANPDRAADMRAHASRIKNQLGKEWPLWPEP